MSELSIPTSLALKCRNLSLGDPNEMIPIPTENRLIELTFYLRKNEKNMAHVSPKCFSSEGVLGRHQP